MTARGAAIAELVRQALNAIDTLSPGEQDEIVAALVADLRTRRPVAIAPLGVLPPPTEKIRDPRGTP